MKKVLKIFKLFLIVLLLAGGTYILYVFFRPSVLLSDSQVKIRELYGIPEQFIITYLPVNEEEKNLYARAETWFYPEANKKISFLAGNIIDVVYLDSDDSIITSAKNRPEEFDLFMGYEDMEKKFGKFNISKIELPGFYSENTETYATDGGLFILENGRLTYLQTYNGCIEGPCLGGDQYLRF